MSWSVSIPKYAEPAEGQEFVNEVEAEKITEALGSAAPEGDLAAGPTKQLKAAKDAAQTLIEGPLKGARAYRVNLSGHANTGEKSETAETVAVEVIGIP